ncbi:hypothetical protein GQ55_1G248000 [Panicum hallii var. hallii]|uniref:Uncharacterized protein n=1 Tax=Panicum hallii var. hallii TaxID=1504633 RepID=A0A2T7F760_9POAL|nr:hypothetical protein GQ55_1G248000 [Panicum hallii var. hallii]
MTRRNQRRRGPHTRARPAEARGPAGALPRAPVREAPRMRLARDRGRVRGPQRWRCRRRSSPAAAAVGAPPAGHAAGGGGTAPAARLPRPVLWLPRPLLPPIEWPERAGSRS